MGKSCNKWASKLKPCMGSTLSKASRPAQGVQYFYYSMIYQKIGLLYDVDKSYQNISTTVGVTGKSLSEALIFASTKPQYDERLLIGLQVQYMNIASS